MFAVVIGVILTAVVVFLVSPLWRRPSTSLIVGDEASVDQELIELEIEREKLLLALSELEIDLAQGRRSQADYHRLKGIYEHRLVTVLERLDLLRQSAPSRPQRRKEKPRQCGAREWALSLGLGLLVVVSASSLYSYIEAKVGLEAQRAQWIAREEGEGDQRVNPLEMVARLEQRLRENPNDLQGQIMAGRSYMALQRWEEAKKAWNTVLELNRRNHEAHFNLGLIILRTASPGDLRMYSEGLAHFDTALINVPQEPTVLWYKGVSLVHLKRFSEADEAWTNALQRLPLGSQESDFVRQALQELRAGRPPLF